MTNTDNLAAREGYRQAQQVLFDAWIDDFMRANAGNPMAAVDKCWDWVKKRKWSQGEIRVEVELNNANNIFTFGMTPTQANSSNVLFPTEERLNLQDTLIASEHGLYFGKPTSRLDTNFELFTHGNPLVWNGAGQAAALNGEVLSNGHFTMKVNGDVIIPYRGLFNHKYVPQTQQTAAFGAGSPFDQIRGAEDGQITDEPNVWLIGSKGYVPQLVLKNTITVDMGFTRAILIYRGWNAQNSTSIN